MKFLPLVHVVMCCSGTCVIHLGILQQSLNTVSSLVHIHTVMTRGEGLSGYYRFLTKYGTYLWLQTRATVMHDSRTGKPSYIVCMNFVIKYVKYARYLHVHLYNVGMHVIIVCM